jgi:hypothetical protein
VGKQELASAGQFDGQGDHHTPRAFVGRGLLEGFDAKEVLAYRHSGFSVDAGVCIEAHDRAALQTTQTKGASTPPNPCHTSPPMVEFPIRKTKEMSGKVVTPHTVTEAGGCFAAGTLVHTKEGLKPIEQIEVGDWVLSKPEDGEGEQAYKRVAKTFSFEEKVVRFVEYSVLRNGEWHQDCVTVTNNHPFWVKGVDASLFPSAMTWDHLQTGWTRADHLFGGLLIELATGETARVTSEHEDVLWKTNRPGIAWKGTVSDDTSGVYRVANTGERDSVYPGLTANLDFWNDETFSARRENTEWEQKWLYTTKVYNFEVEDFHTYYVGKLGAWVHNTNCYGTTVEYMKKHGVSQYR